MALNNYIEDDWDDNALTDRSASQKDVFYAFSDGGTGDLLKGVYRPRWGTESGSPTATNGFLRLDSTDERVITPSQLSVGRWEFDSRFLNAGVSGGLRTYIIANSSSGDGYFIYRDQNIQAFRLYRNDSSTGTIIIDSSGSTVDTNYHTMEVTRNSYGNFELFFDGVSNGTATDTNYGALGYFHFVTKSSDGLDIDNLLVK